MKKVGDCSDKFLKFFSSISYLHEEKVLEKLSFYKIKAITKYSMNSNLQISFFIIVL